MYIKSVFFDAPVRKILFELNQAGGASTIKDFGVLVQSLG
ncbi:hypothetical protein DSOL_2013 [Desulfosporosinus metallidurans]|uniref:Uncharacterized protein n=1 Tax=Desulfosporosinus metallidurans TaxID=1888891 RepID=A0A1Q8QY25_9FIRM|nr:hypothetical protein DSOL_2013 [Desulfosporosinus metallidurans]